jgi:hypothetical protein
MREIMLVFLFGLPFAVIGWIGGMVNMRSNYLRILKWQKRQINRLSRDNTNKRILAANFGRCGMDDEFTV